MSKFDIEALRAVATIAVGIVLEHGHKQTKSSKAARVPYETLERLEKALAAAGYDMAAARALFQRKQAKDALMKYIWACEGVEVHKDEWPIAEELEKDGLITLGPRRGPDREWRRAEPVE